MPTLRRAAQRPAKAAPARRTRRQPKFKRPSLDLALQGGGSHGAFTWGVLDALLAADRFDFDGVSGTSAGALNAAVLATGLAEGGRDGARQALAAFWQDVAATGACFGAATSASGWLDDLPGLWAEWMWRWPAILQKFASPYQFNPLGINPLRDVAARHVKPQALRAGPLKVFVTATSVHTGQAEVFSGERLSIDALLASACLPHLFQAVVIDDVPYWDGGYTGNPALWPLIYETQAGDVLLVKINPLERRATPDTPMEIADRVSEITFNAGLTGELRAIAFVQRLVEEGKLQQGRYKHLRMHMVHDEERLAALGPKTKLDTSWAFLQQLRDMGADAAKAWLAEHAADVGVRDTMDIQNTFLRPRHAPPRR